MRNFRDLQVWRRAHQLTLAVYEATSIFPSRENYGLTSQMRRSCSSIAANLAEGCGRRGDGEMGRFCSIAMGSASELDYHLLLAKDLDLLSASQYKSLADQTEEVRRMLTGLFQTLKTNPKPETKKLRAKS